MRVSVRSVERLIRDKRSGMPPLHRLTPRRVGFRADEVRAFLEGRPRA
jgi:hypothetical protein